MTAELPKLIVALDVDSLDKARKLRDELSGVVDFYKVGKEPKKFCSMCNRCAIATTIYPLGCYDVERFDGNQEKMLEQIKDWNTPAELPDITPRSPVFESTARTRTHQGPDPIKRSE